MNKKSIISLLVTLTILCVSGQAYAAPVFFGYGDEKIVKVEEFPDTDDFRLPSGEYIDVGYRYKQVSILFLPLWNYDQAWAGYVNDETYLDVSKEELVEIAQTVNVTIPASPSLPFWDVYGGKLALVLLLALFAFFKANKKKEEAVAVEEVQETEDTKG